LARSCPSCDANNPVRTQYGRGDWWVARCGDCGFAYLADAPAYEALQGEFEWSQSYKQERKRRRRRPIGAWMQRLVKLRKRLIPARQPMDFVEGYVPDGNVLDIGCGDGGLLEPFRHRYRLFGIELSPILAKRAEQVFAPSGGGVLCATGKEGLQQFRSGSISAAVLHAYLEHELHPKAVLKELMRVLKPGGIAVVKVPNFASVNRHVVGREWCGFRYPDHVNYFTPRSLAEMSEAAGFQVRCSPRDRLPVSDNLWSVLTRPEGEPAFAA
jgi:SAM-dependent methyltransferase